MSPVVRSNWLLLALATLMSLAIYSQLQRQNGYLPITALDSNSIEHLEIWQDGKVTTRLLRRNNGWVHASSGKPAEDPRLADRLLHMAQLPSLHHFSAAAHDLRAFGLKPPRYRLKLDDLTILIGDLDPASGLRYVQVGDRIHLVSDSYTHYLKTGP